MCARPRDLARCAVRRVAPSVAAAQSLRSETLDEPAFLELLRKLISETEKLQVWRCAGACGVAAACRHSALLCVCVSLRYVRRTLLPS
jgi:hypothetical protein